MRIGWLLLYFYGLFFSDAQAATLSTQDLSPDPHISLSSLLDRHTRAEPSAAYISLNTGLSKGIGNGAPILSGQPIEIKPGRDITVSAPPSISAGHITLLPGADIDIRSGIQVPNTRDIITIFPHGGEISLGSSANLTVENITILPNTITSVPLPASFSMLLSGLLGLVSISRRSLFRAR